MKRTITAALGLGVVSAVIAAVSITAGISGKATLKYNDGSVASIDIAIMQANEKTKGSASLAIQNLTRQDSFRFETITIEKCSFEGSEFYMDGVGMIYYGRNAVKVPYSLEIDDNAGVPGQPPDVCRLSLGYGTASAYEYDGYVIAGDLKISYLKN